MRNRLILWIVLFVAGLLIGFIPQYLKASRAENELAVCRSEGRLARMRDLAGLAFLEATRKNYGLATEQAGRFFNHVREVVAVTSDVELKGRLEEILARRDAVTGALAQGEPGVVSQLQELFAKTHEVTAR